MPEVQIFPDPFTLPLLWKILKLKKDVKIIVSISNDECNYLLSKGWKYKSHLHKTYSSANKKYATPNPDLLKDLEEYRKNRCKK